MVGPDPEPEPIESFPIKNRILVIYQPGQPVRCYVWDNEGNRHDGSASFLKIRGVTTRGVVTNELLFQSKEDDSTTLVTFEATGKRLQFDVPSSVILPILSNL